MTLETFLLAAAVMVLIATALVGAVFLVTLAFVLGIRNAIIAVFALPRELWRFYRSGVVTQLHDLADEADACPDCDRRSGYFCDDHAAALDEATDDW